jgi:hypothetical protein
MADNVGYTPGTGATVAADDIGGVLYQRVKIAVGNDGSADDVSPSHPLPVVIQNGDPLTVSIDNATPVDVAITNTTPILVSDETQQAAISTFKNDLLDSFSELQWRLDSPKGYDAALNRTRQTTLVESGTITTVTTVTALTNLGDIQSRLLPIGQNQAAWAAIVRARIS